MSIFAAMAVVPGVLVYAVSLQFAVKSIDSWFNVRVDAALESGLQLGRSSLEMLLGQLADKADRMVEELELAPQVRSTLLNHLRERGNVESATVFASNGRIVATADAEIESLVPERPSVAQLRQARQTQGYRAVEGQAPDGLILRVIVPIPSRHLADPLLLQLTQSVPSSFASHAESVETVHRDYQELSLARGGLKRIYTLTLTLTLLLALFAAVAVAFVLTRRLAAPLFILAEGTQAVAAGDFSPRQALPARDELGVLTQSFNQMTRQLEDARAQAENNRAAVERNRAYLEGVLANLSAGVLAFSPDGHLRAANHGAMTILNDPLDGYERIRLEDWADHGASSQCLAGRACTALTPTGTARSSSPTRTAAPRPCSSTVRAFPTTRAVAGWWYSMTSLTSSRPSARRPGRRWRGVWPTRSRTPSPLSSSRPSVCNLSWRIVWTPRGARCSSAPPPPSSIRWRR
jgi:nitrogen fixation/metabolism regulation signal transduction histidine kinase